MRDTHPAFRAKRGEGGLSWRVLRWVYARWIQILALINATGADGKPSFSKISVVVVTVCGCYLHSEILLIAAMCAAFGPKMLITFLCAWRGTSVSETRRETVTVRNERDASLGVDPA